MQKPKPGYKLVKSLFGKYEEIPEDWEVKKFDELFEFLRTGTNSRDDLCSHGDVQYIHYGDIHAKWRTILDCDVDEIPFIDKSKVTTLPLLKDGDLIITDASEDYAGSGSSVLLKNVKTRKIVSGLHTIAIRSADPDISMDFNRYLTSIKFVKNQIIAYVTGISVYGLSKNNFKKIRIPLPPTQEQQKIATILSNVDYLISSYNNIIDSTKLLKQGLMQTLLTKGIGHKKFKKIKWLFGKEIEIPDEWEMRLLSDLSQVVDSRHFTPKYTEKGIPLILPNNVTQSGLDFSNTKFTTKDDYAELIAGNRKPEKNDIIYTRNASFGVANQVVDNTLFSLGQDLVLIKPTVIEPYLLFRILNSEIILQQLTSLVSGSTFKRINLEFIRSFLIPTSNKQKEQQKIASILSNVDSKISELESKKSHIEKIKKGLMQKLLTGQIRIRV